MSQSLLHLDQGELPLHPNREELLTNQAASCESIGSQLRRSGTMGLSSSSEGPTVPYHHQGLRVEGQYLHNGTKTMVLLLSNEEIIHFHSRRFFILPRAALMLKVVVMLIARIVGTTSMKITRQILRKIPTQNWHLVQQQRASMSHRTKRSSGSLIRQSTRLLMFHDTGILLGDKSRLY